MGVKSVVSDRLGKAKSFADSVRRVYEHAYNKAMDMSKGGLSELVQDIEPKIRAAIDDGLHGAQTVLDDFNQSLADKAVPAFRKGAVSKELLDQKAKQVVGSEGENKASGSTEALLKKEGLESKPTKSSKGKRKVVSGASKKAKAPTKK